MKVLTLTALKIALIVASANAQTGGVGSSDTGRSGTAQQSGSQSSSQSSDVGRTPGSSQTGRSAAGQSSQSGQTSQSGQGSQAGQSGQSGQQSGQLDDAIAAGLLLGNQEEVALAQFAQDRLQDPKAKQFAQMMIRDHQQAAQKLQQMVPQLANVQLSGAQGSGATSGQGSTGQASQSPQRGQSGQSGQSGLDQGSQRSQVAGSQGAAGGQQTQQMLMLHQAVAQQCLQLTQQELEEKEGREFDMAYIGQQCVAHTQMLAKLQASEQFASGELRQMIGQMTQTVEQHRKMAKEIKESLKGGESAGSTAQGGQDSSRR